MGRCVDTTENIVTNRTRTKLTRYPSSGQEALINLYLHEYIFPFITLRRHYGSYSLSGSFEELRDQLVGRGTTIDESALK